MRVTLALQRLALERIERDVDGLADGDARHIHFAQVGRLDAEGGQVAEGEDGLSSGEHFAFAGVDVADGSGEGRFELQLVQVGLSQIGGGLGLSDVGLSHGDLFLGCPGHHLIEPRLGRVALGLGGLHGRACARAARLRSGRL